MTGIKTVPFEKWKQATGYPCHRPIKDENRLNIFIN